MAKWVMILPLVFLSIFNDLTSGRLTEITTERLPVLFHNLHKANIDLKAISRRASLGPRSEFRFKNGEFHQTAKGSQRVRLVQTYAGYEVYGPAAVAELNTRGHFTGHLYGEVAKDLHKDIPNPEACTRDVKVLVNKAIRLEKLNLGDPNIDKRDGRRAIYADSNKRKAKIIYVVEFFYKGNNFLTSPVYYMDACSNTVLFSFDKIRNISLSEANARYRTIQEQMDMKALHDVRSRSLKFKMERAGTKAGVPCLPSVAGRGGNPNTGQIFYNTEPYCLPVKKSGFTCTMEGTFVNVIDNENTESQDKKTPISFDCTTGYDDAVNGAFGVANDAFFYGEISGQFFVEVFNKRALPYIPRLVVHYGRNYENAFWTGTDMFFGDGKSIFYPLVYIDITAHELAHGITTRNSDLIYIGMSGGINEAFSDISAMATYFYMMGEPLWSVGAALMKSGSGALRYMDDPPKDGKSIKNAWRFRPLMNVHYSSGVFNHAFYHMVHTYNLNMYVAYAAFLNANRLLWGKFTRFRRGACNVVQAGYDTGADYMSMRNSFVKSWLFLSVCRYKALKTTMFPGETRENILVSRERSPILEIDMSNWSGSSIEIANSWTLSGSVKMVLATDDDANDVIAKGDNYIQFPGNHTKLHVKLSSDHKQDVKVTLKVSI